MTQNCLLEAQDTKSTYKSLVFLPFILASTTVATTLCLCGQYNLFDGNFAGDDINNQEPILGHVKEMDTQSSYDSYSFPNYYEIGFKEQRNVQIFRDFAKQMLESSVDIDPSIAEVVDTHFWEMI